MNTFSLIYSETKKQVLAIIFLPLLLVAIYIVILEAMHYDPRIPIWLSVVIFIVTIIVTMLLFMNKVVNLPAQVTITPEAINITLDHTNFLYSKKEILIELGNIEKLTEDINNQNNDKKYFTITTRQPAKSILIMQPRKMDDSIINEFSAMLHNNIQSYNSNPHTPVATKIKEGSFYDATWAKVITYITYIALAAVPVAALVGANIEWYKIIQVYAFGIAWLIAYHTGRKKSKINKY
ncbi:MAG: hypothetical protein JWQ09_919 [Segetibacter sp.]|nr:hypothetical protein [Segetibacter sp.]